MAAIDLSSFIQNLAAQHAKDNIKSQLGQAALGMDVNVRNPSSPFVNIATNLAKGVLSGALLTSGQNEERRYEAALPGLAQSVVFGRPIEASAISSLGDDAGGAIQQLRVFKAANDFANQQKIFDLQNEIALAGLKKEAEVGAEQRAYASALGGGVGSAIQPVADSAKSGSAIQNPDTLAALSEVNPIAKGVLHQQERKEDLATKDLERLTGLYNNTRDYLKGQSADYLTARQNLELITKGFKDTSPASDLTLAIAANKILDPGSVVREGEIQNVQQIVPYLERSIKGFKNYVTPEGLINAEGKTALLKSIAPKLEKMGTDYQGVYDAEMNKVKALKGDPSLVTAPKYEPFNVDDFLKSVQTQNSVGLGGISPEAAAAELQRRQQMKIEQLKTSGALPR